MNNAAVHLMLCARARAGIAGFLLIAVLMQRKVKVRGEKYGVEYDFQTKQLCRTACICSCCCQKTRVGFIASPNPSVCPSLGCAIALRKY